MKYLISLLPLASLAVTFEEFAATYPDKDIHRARAAYEASIAPPAPVVTPTPEEIEAARVAALVSEYEARTAQSWPLLAAHPQTNEVPAQGMCYRLTDGGVTTWWVLRQGDLIATQISAHSTNGEQIVRSINLRTGDETEINLARIAGANSFAQMRTARVVRTNAIGRARQ